MAEDWGNPTKHRRRKADNYFKIRFNHPGGGRSIDESFSHMETKDFIESIELVVERLRIAEGPAKE